MTEPTRMEDSRKDNLLPLVGKLEIIFRNVAVKRISDFQKRWGNSGHLTGSLLSNLMILETMLSSDFFSDLSLLSYECMA